MHYERSSRGEVEWVMVPSNWVNEPNKSDCRDIKLQGICLTEAHMWNVVGNKTATLRDDMIQRITNIVR